MKPMNFRTSIIAATVLILLSGTAWSEINVTPRFFLSQEYNDNVFLTDSNRQSDWITTLEPGVNLLYNQRSIEASLDYSLRYRFYQDNTDEDQDSFRDVQRGAADVMLFGSRPFTLNVRGTIARETIDARDNDPDFILNDSQDRYTTVYRLIVNPQYRLRITQTFSSLLGYTFNLVDYSSSEGDDYLEHQGYLELNKSLSSALDVRARYQYTTHDNDDSTEDFERHDALLGGNYRLSSRTTLDLMIGRSRVEYDSGLDTNSTIWSTNLSWQATAAVNFSLGYSRDFRVTAVDGLSRSQEARFTVAYVQPLTGVTAGVYLRELDYVRQSRKDEAYGATLRVTRRLSASLSGSVDGGYERADNTNPDEEYDRYTAGVSLGYEYRRFGIALAYRYRLNDSDTPGRDYRNNIVTLSGTLRF